MDAERFRHLLSARKPFASVYFEDSHDTEDADAQLDLKWRDLAHQLAQHSADDQVITSIERAVMDLRPPIGRSGRAIVADADGVVLNEHLLAPTATVVRVSPLPYILPVVERGFVFPTYVLVAVDHTGADITVHVNGRLGAETADGGGYPVHTSSGAETAGYGDPQQRTDEAGRKNVRAVADRVAELADREGADAVFIVGEVHSRSDLLAQLPQRVVDRAVVLQVGARHSGHDDIEVQRGIETEYLKRRMIDIDNAAQTFAAERNKPSGLAAEGLDAVCAALTEGAVETLIIGDVGDATVVADEKLTITAANPDVLSDYGAAPSHTLRADEALPIAAVSTDAAIVRADGGIDPADGVAALLRYRR
jgi:hypothetical protein